jgi:hypothetical protein
MGRSRLLSKSAAQLKVRLPEPLRRKIEREAHHRNATLTDTIVDHLEDYYEWRDATKIPLDDALLGRLEDAAAVKRHDLEDEAAERLDKSFECMWFVPSERIRAELEIAAELNNRSINEEIEHRIDHSFTVELQFYQEAGAVHLRRAVNIIIDLITDLEIITGRRVFGPEADPWAHYQAAELIKTWLVINRPSGNTEAPPLSNSTWHNYLKPMPKKFVEHFGALMVLKEYASPGSYQHIETRYYLDLFKPVPLDPRFSIAPGRGSALLYREEQEAAIAHRFMSRNKRSPDQLFVGTYNVQTDYVVWRGSLGRSDGPLPLADDIKRDWYLVCLNDGTGSGNAPAVALRAGDQLRRDPTGSTAWYVQAAPQTDSRLVRPPRRRRKSM